MSRRSPTTDPIPHDRAAFRYNCPSTFEERLDAPEFSSLSRIIEAADLAPRREAPELILVDLGGPARYAERHIPGARHLDVMRTHSSSPPSPGLLPDKAALERLLGELGHRPEAVYAADQPRRRYRGRPFLLAAGNVIGHPNWHYLNGSLPAWMETISTAEPGRTRSSKECAQPYTPGEPGRHSRIPAGAPWRSRYGGLDARSPAEYCGAKSACRASAVTYQAPSISNGTLGLYPQRNMRIRENIADLLASQGITPDKEVITHCHTHRRSGFTYMLARALGYPRIKGYARPWAERATTRTDPIQS